MKRGFEGADDTSGGGTPASADGPGLHVSSAAHQAEYDSLVPPLRLSRRRFLTTSLAAGFAAAAGPVSAQTAIKTDSAGLAVGEVRIPVEGGAIPAYRAMPEGKTGVAVVLVIQEIFGVHEYIQDVCRRLAHAGYMAVAPELFVRQGDPKRYTDISRLISEVVSKVPDEQVMKDLDATAAWAGANGGNANRLGVNGFCWGGRIAWLYAAHNPRLKAGVAWYGRLEGKESDTQPRQPIGIVKDINAPVLGIYGGNDSGIPVESVDKMKAALAKGSDAAKASQIVVYPDVGHAFHADNRPSYREEHANDGWEKAIGWFNKYLA